MGMFDKMKPVRMDMTPDQVGPVGVSTYVNENLDAIKQQLKQDEQEIADASSQEVQDVLSETTDQKGEYKRIPIGLLISTPAAWNKFTPPSNDMKIQMADSIVNTGLQQPIVVRELDEAAGNYQILAGNTRTEIYRILFEKTGDDRFASIPAIVYAYGAIDDDTARQIVIDTNYAQRGELPKRDKMFAIHEKLAFLRRRREKDSLSRVAKMIDRNRTTVYYWDSIYNLIPELFELFERDAINMAMAAKLGTYMKETQEQLASVKDLLTNEIIKALPRYMRPEEAVDVFNSTLESETMPAEEPPRGEWHVKRSARSIHVTVTGKHDAYEPFVVLIPKKKAKSFVKKYDEFILRPDESEAAEPEE